MLNFESLLQVASDARDPAWENEFLREFPQQRVRVLRAEPQQGPDGWPYLLVETGQLADEPVRGPLGWLAERGIGMAINPFGASTEHVPDYALTYGMIWNFAERGEFLSAPPSRDRASGLLELKHGQTLFVGPPSAGYLPKAPRLTLKQFFLDQGAFAPKALMVGVNQTDFDLCFSIESLGSPPVEEHAGILEALSWFLPAHYSLALLSEKTAAGWVAL